mgnify:CR=1 FL=1|jgi:hypothetical protein
MLFKDYSLAVLIKSLIAVTDIPNFTMLKAIEEPVKSFIVAWSSPPDKQCP